MENIVDLRSDTVTKPSDEMRNAMYQAEVGDNIYGEDPTVNRLEKRAAEICGKEDAVYLPSGTMGNLAAILTHCGRGSEIILGDQSHIFYYEAGGISAAGSIHPRTVKNNSDGTIDLDEIEKAIRSENVHFPRTSLVCLENTHNRCGGSVLTVEYMNNVSNLLKAYNIPTHLDGSRIFNAAIALNLKEENLCSSVDSVNICMSKGLGAPVGSLICGNREFILEARRNIKMLGGGMRQCGIIAAGGLFALDNMRSRLAEDHNNAGIIVDKLSEHSDIKVKLNNIPTNIVYFEVKKTTGRENDFVKMCAGEGVLFASTGKGVYRLVTHYGITEEDCMFSCRKILENIEKFNK